jgi:hypothetical protein
MFRAFVYIGENMSIIPVSMLENFLPADAENNNTELSNAVNSASGHVNSWTSNKYDTWDNYNETNGKPRAPFNIVDYTLKIAKVIFQQNTNSVSRGGDDDPDELLKTYEDALKIIQVPPSFIDQTISLDSNGSQIIGSRTTTTGKWTRVVPADSHITSGGSSVYVYNDDFWINKGGDYDNEYTDAWYLRTNTGSSVEGTLSYRRTYRNDMHDYLTYMK